MRIVLIIFTILYIISLKPLYALEKTLIINNNTKVFKELNSNEVVATLPEFESITILDPKKIKGFVNIKIATGIQGWVEEKYTALIPQNWKRFSISKAFSLYTPRDQRFIYTKIESESLDDTGYEIKLYNDKLFIDIAYFHFYKKLFKGEEKKYKRFVYHGISLYYLSGKNDLDNSSFIELLLYGDPSEKYIFNISTDEFKDGDDKTLLAKKILFSIRKNK